MAISAYREGRLKKNPLLGTSLAIDPNRVAMRSGYQDLIKEARATANEGREGMLRRLSERYGSLQAEHQPRLTAIPKEIAALEADARTWIDYDKYQKMQQRAGSANKYLTELGRSDPSMGYQPMIEGDFKTEVDAAFKEAKKTNPRLDKATFSRDYMTKAVRDLSEFESGIQARIADVNARQYFPLKEEAALRQKTLRDRADLYNAFLGMDLM